MRVLFIAPLPPPVTGQSLVSQHLLEYLTSEHEVAVVDIRKQSLKDGLDSPGRALEVLGFLRRIYRERKHADVIYLTIAESVAGNLKDLMICLLCRKLKSKIYIHLHGGSLRRELFERHRFVFWLNKIVLKGLGGAIVSGPSHLHVFDGIVVPSRVHIAANFAPDDMFSSETEIAMKFSSLNQIRVLYMSHMTERKGYRRLAEALIGAAEMLGGAIRVDFAGAFESEGKRASFLEAIRGHGHLNYHGVVDEEAKRLLYRQAHVFCLPTSFFEGQPISILEAYASGCVVLTTGQAGIRDVFANGENGLELSGNTSVEIARGLCAIVDGRRDLQEIAMHNFRLANERYRASVSLPRIGGIIRRALTA